MRRPVLSVVTALAVALSSAPAAAASQLEAFDAAAWKRLQSELQRPAIVVFSATYCTICPQVIDALAATTRARKAQLVAVVIDGDGRNDLLQAAHYRSVDRLFVFKGEEAALRYTVQPRWRGVTPFVVLLSKGSPPVFVTGEPSVEQIKAWRGD